MAPPRKIAADKSDKVLSRRILVNVKRDQSLSTPVCIWAHEFPLLEAIHGEGNITAVDLPGLDEGYSAKTAPSMMPFNKTQDKIKPPSETLCLGFVFNGDARSEYDRLAMVYGRMEEVNITVVEAVYARFNGGNFERVIGSPEHSDMPEQQLRQIIESYGFLIEVTSDSTDAEVQEAKAKRKQLLAMSHDELVKTAEELVNEYA